MRFLAISNLWVSFGVTCFVWMSSFLLDKPVPQSYLITVFFASLLVYSFQRLNKPWTGSIYPDGSVASSPKKAMRMVYFIGIAGLAGSLVSLFYVPWPMHLSLIPSGVFAFLYTWKWKGGKSLRDVPYLKIHLIAVSWSLLSILGPVSAHGWSMDVQEWTLLVINYLMIIALTIPFDTRDLPIDPPTMKTIPQLIGQRSSHVLAGFLMALCVSAIQFFYMDTLNYLWLLSGFLACFIVLFRGGDFWQYYCAIVVDGVFILLAASLMV